jgi:alpha-beta hydrolase superfamily lysophospholipase
MSCPSLPSTLLARDGLPLHVSQWPVSRPRGVIQLIHGLCEHAGRYSRAALALNDAGWAVVALDQRGHGLSSGPRGGLAHDEDLLHDQVALYDAVAQAFQGVPRLLLGIGMGGLVAARLVASLVPQHEDAPWVRRFDGLILVAPALQPTISFTQRALMSAFGRLAPDLAVTSGFKPEWTCSDAQEVEAAYRDPLIHDRITPRLTYFMHDAGEYVQSRASGWVTPTMLLFSHADRLVSPSACQRFAEALPRGLISVQAYENLAHDLLHEPERVQVKSAMRQWLEEQFPAAMSSQGLGVLRQTGS